MTHLWVVWPPDTSCCWVGCCRPGVVPVLTRVGRGLPRAGHGLVLAVILQLLGKVCGVSPGLGECGGKEELTGKFLEGGFGQLADGSGVVEGFEKSCSLTWSLTASPRKPNIDGRGVT